MSTIYKYGDIKLCCIPGLTEVEGANEAAGAVLYVSVDTGTGNPYTYFEEFVDKCIQEKWQRGFDGGPHSELFTIHPKLGEWNSAPGGSRVGVGGRAHWLCVGDQPVMRGGIWS